MNLHGTNFGQLRPYCDLVAGTGAIALWLGGHMAELAAGASLLYTVVSLFFLIRDKRRSKKARRRKYDYVGEL